MNRVLLIAALASVSTLTFAASGEETCKKISAVAGEAMETRQRGDLLEDAMSSVGDKNRFSDAMVVKAYTAPVVVSSEGKRKVVFDFRNTAYSDCYWNIIEPTKQ